MKKTMIALAALASCAFAAPVLAQQSAVKAGDLWTAGRIDVEDGQFENYMDYLVKTWAPSQDYAKSQGWISEYHILSSPNPRDGEPDIILITRHADFPSAAEAERRDVLMNQYMKQDDHTAAAASGNRLKMRRLMGSVMYRELHKR